MKRIAVIVVIVGLVGSMGLAAVFSVGSSRPVYSVAEVRAGLAHSPRAWVGQTVLIRAVLGSGFPIRWLPFVPARPLARRIGFARFSLVRRLILPFQPGGVLVDASTQPPALGLPLGFAPQNRVLSFLRDLPWVGRFAPGPQTLNVQGDQPTVYRVRIAIAPTSTCGQKPCYEALLLDSAPPTWPLVVMHGLAPVPLSLPLPISPRLRFPAQVVPLILRAKPAHSVVRR